MGDQTYHVISQSYVASMTPVLKSTCQPAEVFSGATPIVAFATKVTTTYDHSKSKRAQKEVFHHGLSRSECLEIYTVYPNISQVPAF